MATLKQPTSKIELRFSCTKLRDMDVLSKSDPMIIVHAENLINKGWDKIGRTERQKNTLSPTFQTPIKVDYYFEQIQKLRITVLDVDNDHNLDDSKGQEEIGIANVTLGNILSKAGQTAEVQILDKHQKPAGMVRVSAEQLMVTNQHFKMRLGGEGLDKKDLFGKSDPYFKMFRKTNNAAGFALVYTSEVHKQTLDPVFNECVFKLEDICGGDMTAPIRFEFYDWDSVGKHDFIGAFQTNTNDLLVKGMFYKLVNEKKQQKDPKNYKGSGKIKVFESELVREYNFLEYIAGGCEISLIVGIDCTGSNGEVTSPTSLHYQHPTNPNQYAKAIVSIGNVLAPYDFDGFYPVYGFGGVYPGSSQVSHCFPFAGPQQVFARGVEGILDAYYRNIGGITLSGPTYFAPLIREAASQASVPQNQVVQKYTILLIITDGEILDMENTIDAIVEASGLPLSIVIIGVGNASFTAMKELDADNGLLKSSKGQYAERDIVQFVPFQSLPNFEALASETLREIPGQFMAFMNKYKFKPNPPRVYQPPPVQTVQPVPSTTTPTVPPTTTTPTTQ
ncbi:phospholipid-binding protein [Tieghemostelium lacteum]|uniref:Phospholipid-binding protein n=1 Tax=Tieghemostelium lacteum TaxID=361077 RepID=A0A151ZB49_TIELA|nr:phospholipid-binding protein [Tieghemostelium lacteum]|eukprot:KYQ91161.1 phospholipid-binding protein [Tieghemostelium lacteum]